MKKKKIRKLPKVANNTASLPLTIKTSEAARLLNVCEKTIREGIRKKQIPAFNIGRIHHIPRERFLKMFKGEL